MKTLAIFALLQCLRPPMPPRMVAANFAIDLLGVPDTRPQTWGNAGYWIWRMEFRQVPAGARVCIRRIRGDCVAWAKDNQLGGKHAGILLGLQRPSTGASAEVTPAADGTVLYLQHAVSGGNVARLDFDNKDLDFILDSDNILEVKVAVWLNTLGTIHMEPTLIVHYDYVP